MVFFLGKIFLSGTKIILFECCMHHDASKLGRMTECYSTNYVIFRHKKSKNGQFDICNI